MTKRKINGTEYEFAKVVDYENLKDKGMIGRNREGRHFWFCVACLLIGCFIVGIVL